MRIYWAVAPISCALLLTGCSVAPVLTSSSTPAGSVHGATIKGMVHGGQNPLSGAHVYFYAIGNTGYGGQAISLLTKGDGQDSYGFYVLSASDGSFSITGDYTCPVANSYPVTYLMALGGDSGSGNNSAISLIAPVGDCTATNFASNYVVINEVSTVATTYVAQGVITDLTHVSAPNTTLAQTEVSNFDTSVLYVGGVAQATTPYGNGTAPQAEVNTLSNILAACVNSSGPSSSQCTTLFANSPTTGSSPTDPTDTATAIGNIARNPGANIANLFALQSGSPPFQPDLSSAPNDFTLAITHTATPALSTPSGIAIDSSGNVWVANDGNGSLTEFGPDGGYTRTVTTGGLDGPVEIAIDGSGNLWVANRGGSSISEFNSSGTAITGSPFTGGGLSTPEDLAVDAQGHLWVANSGANVLSEFNVSNGSPVSSTGITTASLNSSNSVAVDDNGLVWVSNSGNNTVSLWNPGANSGNGMAYTGSPFSGGGLASPRGLAIDSNNNAWIANHGADVLSSFSNAGANNATGYSGGGLNGSLNVAVDPSDHVWVLNRVGNNISEFAPNGTAISPSTGYLAGLNNPGSIAIDLNGNVWVTNTNNNTLVEFVGAATPLVTPVAANLITGHGYGASAVNKP